MSLARRETDIGEKELKIKGRRRRRLEREIARESQRNSAGGRRKGEKGQAEGEENDFSRPVITAPIRGKERERGRVIHPLWLKKKSGKMFL